MITSAAEYDAWMCNLMVQAQADDDTWEDTKGSRFRAAQLQRIVHLAVGYHDWYTDKVSPEQRVGYMIQHCGWKPEELADLVALYLEGGPAAVLADHPDEMAAERRLQAERTAIFLKQQADKMIEGFEQNDKIGASILAVALPARRMINHDAVARRRRP